MGTKEFLKAADEWTNWISIAPKSSKGYLRRGDAFLKAGKQEEAIQDLSHALELEKSPRFRGVILVSRANAYDMKGATRFGRVRL